MNATQWRRQQYARVLAPLGKDAIVQCHYCTWEGIAWIATVDHIVPKARGADEPENFTWACEECNSEKDNSLPECRCEECELAVTIFAIILHHRVITMNSTSGYTSRAVIDVRLLKMFDWYGVSYRDIESHELYNKYPRNRARSLRRSNMRDLWNYSHREGVMT